MRDVKFLQTTIKPTFFKDGRPVQQLIDDIKSGKADPASLPPVRVVMKDGEPVTLDHRRLYVLREAFKYRRDQRISVASHGRPTFPSNRE